MPERTGCRSRRAAAFRGLPCPKPLSRKGFTACGRNNVLLISFRIAAYSFTPSSRCETARAAMLMRQPGASRRIAEAHESSVEPVVITSSTSRTCRPASRSGRHTAKASSTLPARSPRGLEGLAGGVAHPADAAAVDLHAQLRGDPLGDVFRLIIPPPATLKGVQRQRNDHLHVVVESAFTQIPPVPRAHLPGRAPRPAVLEAVDQPPPAAQAPTKNRKPEA